LVASNRRGAAYDPDVLEGVTGEELAEQLPGRTVDAVGRQGKYLVLRLSHDLYMTVHLGMTGGLRVMSGEDSVDHERLALCLDADVRKGANEGSVERLAFIDIRKFGRVRLSVGSPWSGLDRLGPDAWRGEWGAE